jgi:hypothetical protein
VDFRWDGNGVVTGRILLSEINVDRCLLILQRSKTKGTQASYTKSFRLSVAEYR